EKEANAAEDQEEHEQEDVMVADDGDEQMEEAMDQINVIREEAEEHVRLVHAELEDHIAQLKNQELLDEPRLENVTQVNLAAGNGAVLIQHLAERTRRRNQARNMPPKGKTSGARAPAKKTAAKPKSSSAKAKAKAKIPSGVDVPGADAPQAAASIQVDRVHIPRKAVKPVAAVSASADEQGAAAPETLVASPAPQADGQSTPKAKTWGDDFLPISA
ncbi:hypothetical protein BBJ28_00026949, partial [Nothophytophthora sp. Chile5]